MDIRSIKDILIIGDLHISDRHRGRHKSYVKVCLEFMYTILSVAKEQKPKAIIFLGDIVGVREKTIRTRAFLLELCAFFATLNSITDNNVYSLKGNHDFGQNSEFDFLKGLNCFKTTDEVKYLDIYNKEGNVDTRFHFVDYGAEKEPIDLRVGSSNVVLCHNNIKIPGQTIWYPDCPGFELSTMLNWEGVDMIIAGHIHDASPSFNVGQINGKEVYLFYPGCGTRPIYSKNIYEKVWFVKFFFNEEEDCVDYEPIEIKLADPETVFFTDNGKIEELSEDELDELVRKENLHEFVQDLIEYRIATGNPIEQLRLMPDTKPEAVELACSYVEKAFYQLGVTK